MASRSRAKPTGRPNKRMSAGEVQALVESERADSLHSFQSSSLQNDRSKALDYYLGDMSEDLPTLPDRSTVVSTDVRDTIEGIMPSMMEIFASGDEVVRYEAVGPEDEDQARQETDYVNHVFLHQNPGWFTLYTFIKDALLSKMGVVKVWWGTETEESFRATYQDLTDDEFGLLLSDDTLEMVAHTERDAPSLPVPPPMPVEAGIGAGAGGGDGVASPLPPPQTPMAGPMAGPMAAPQPPPAPVEPPEPGKLHDVTVVRNEETSSLQLMPVPPEEFGISRRAKSIKDATYVFHEVTYTPTDLINMGFDRKQVESLPTGDEYDDEERLARDTVQESDDQHLGSTNWSARSIRVVEHYIEMDYEGDGMSRLYRVTTASNQGQILKKNGKPDIVEVDEKPFAAMTPVPITHRFFGLSVADLISDIQRIKTSLTRSMLDNIYLSNNQRLEVAEEGATRNTINDVLDNKPGGIVRTKRIGSIAPIPNQPIGDFVMPMVQYMDATREWRTGVTRQGQGIDADALQNQTAEAVSKVFTAAQARMRLMARIFAETGIKDLFALVHDTIRKNDDKANTVRLKNKWVEVDPRSWQRRKDLTVSVGLGSGSREQMMQFLMTTLKTQIDLMSNMPGMVAPKNIYHTLKKIIESAGMRSPEPFYADPGDEPYQPPPDPEAEKTKAEMQMKQQELQMKMEELKADMAMKQQDHEAKAQESQSRIQLEGIQAQADIATQNRKTESEIALAERKFQLERELKILDAKLKAAVTTNGEGEGGGGIPPEVDEMLTQILATPASGGNAAGNEMMAEAMNNMAQAIGNMNRPKKVAIVRDQNGKAVGAEVQ